MILLYCIVLSFIYIALCLHFKSLCLYCVCIVFVLHLCHIAIAQTEYIGKDQVCKWFTVSVLSGEATKL